MLDVFFPRQRIYQDVVNESDYEFSQKFMRDIIYKSLEHTWSTNQTIWPYPVLVVSRCSAKGPLPLAAFPDTYQIILYTLLKSSFVKICAECNCSSEEGTSGSG